MGVGKTLTAIATIWAFVRTKTQRKCLIITPSSLVDNWVKEIKHWLGALRLYALGWHTHQKNV